MKEFLPTVVTFFCFAILSAFCLALGIAELFLAFNF